MRKHQKCYLDNAQKQSPEREARNAICKWACIAFSGSARSYARKKLIRMVGVATGCFVTAFFLAACDKSTSSPAPTPKPTQKVDLNAVRAKAEGGDAQAQKELGTLYSKGEAVKQSYRDAAEWYQKAADQGHAAAQAALGELYEVGQGVKRDEAEAAKWYRKSAEQGYAPGQYSLAVLYVKGSGLQANEAEALKWYRLAAEQGEPQSEYNLGMRYKEGKGVTADPVESYKWLSLAAANGIKDAETPRAELKKSLSRQQISEAETRVRNFGPKKSPAPSQ